MPKPSEYTPARRRVMQVTVWVIMLGTVGLAEVVSQSAKRANRVELAPQSIAYDGVAVHLPRDKWRTRARGDDPRVVVQAAEAGTDDDSRARTVRVMVDRLDAPMSPLQYLDVAFGVAPPNDPSPDTEFALVSTTKVAEQWGVLVSVQSMPMRRGEPTRDLYACAILPSLRALVVHLHGVGEPTPADRAVVGSIAGAITVAGEPPVERAGGEVTLAAEEIRFTTPNGYVAVAPRDENRTDRLLWSAQAAAGTRDKSGRTRGAIDLERDWTTVEIVGCLAPSGKGIEAKQRDKMSSALLTMLLARDPELWRGATISPEGDNLWRAEPARPVRSSGEPSSPASFPARAYLITNTKGLGLLAIFRGGFEGGGFDADWKSLADSVSFPDAPPMDVAAAAQAGTDEVRRLRDAGYEKTLADRVEQWWLWSGGGEHPHLGWSHVDFNLHALEGKGETRLRRPDKAVSRITHEFSYRDSDARYRGDVRESDSDGQELRWSIQQTTNVTGDQVSIGVPLRSTPPTIVKTPLPPNFIPGALLPSVLGKLRVTTPMLLRTESFPGCEAAGAPELLTVLIRPMPNVTTRKADGETAPMRCVTAQVNGRGAISRWYFRQGGEVEQVEFPGGVRLVPADQSSITFNFANDKQMSP